MKWSSNSAAFFVQGAPCAPLHKRPVRGLLTRSGQDFSKGFKLLETLRSQHPSSAAPLLSGRTSPFRLPTNCQQRVRMEAPWQSTQTELPEPTPSVLGFKPQLRSSKSYVPAHYRLTAHRAPPAFRGPRQRHMLGLLKISQPRTVQSSRAQFV